MNPKRKADPEKKRARRFYVETAYETAGGEKRLAMSHAMTQADAHYRLTELRQSGHHARVLEGHDGERHFTPPPGWEPKQVDR
jgi:hypothetical protein